MKKTMELSESAKHYYRDKHSYGIACCRFTKNGRPEILLINKRYTYAYNTFVHGRYDSNNNYELLSLFNNMTTDEKVGLLSLNFPAIWYHVWLHHPMNKSQTYYQAQRKFEETFMRDNGEKLRGLINNSCNVARIWEMPKGKRDKNESEINCAVREFYEETGIPKQDYKIVPNASITVTHIDAGIKYVTKYFVAVVASDITPCIKFSISHQIDEVADMRWMNIDQVRVVDTAGRISPGIRTIFNLIKKRRKDMRL